MIKIISLLSFLICLSAYTNDDKEKNPFGFFYNKEVGRYFFNGQKVFYVEGDLLKGNRVKVEASVDGKGFRPFNKGVRMEKEGKHKIEYRAVDFLGQVLFEKEIYVYLDSSPPQTSVISSGDVKEVKGIYCVSDPRALRLETFDALSGVSKTEYSHDGKNYQVYIMVAQ